MSDKRYLIKHISEKQLNVIKTALEMYTRLGILQFGSVIDTIFNWRSDEFTDGYLKNSEMIEYHCNQIKRLLVSEIETLNQYNDSNWSLGISHEKTNLEAKMAYELEKDISKLLGDKRGRLTLTKEEPTVVEEMNLRIDKLEKVVNKIKSNGTI